MDIKDVSTKDKWIQTLKFGLFSASAGVIQISSFTLLNELVHWSYWPSYLISLILSVIWNFTFNRKFTFKSAKNVPIAMLLVFAYYLVFTPLSTWWGSALTNGAHWNEYLVLAITMIINFVTELLYNQFVVYRKDMNTAVKDNKNNTATTTTTNENDTTSTSKSSASKKASTKESNK